MSKPLTRQKARLARRQNAYRPDSKSRGATTLPGSMNAHKATPTGSGRRSRTKVQADSRTATAR